MAGFLRVQHRPGETRLFLTGTLRLVSNGADVLLPHGAQRLLGYLVLIGRPRDRRLISSALWPDASMSRATGNLRSAVWRIRKAAPEVLDANGTLLSVNPEVWLDL